MKRLALTYSWRYRVVTLCSAVALASFGATQTTQPIHFYQLSTAQLSDTQTRGIADNFGFTQEMDPTGKPLPIWGMADGSVRQLYINGNLEVIPDLVQAKGTAPTLDVAKRNADAFASQFGLFPDDVSKWSIGDSLLWTRQDASQTGQGAPVTPIRSLRYQRMIDGLPVYGPSSLLSFDVNASGLIGLLFNVRAASPSTAPVFQKRSDQINAEYKMKIDVLLRLNPGTAKLVSRTLCYFEQGLRYIQPAYRYRVEIIGSKSDKTGEEFFIPLATNPPEALSLGRFNGFDPIIPEMTPPAPGIQAETTNVKLGEYVVRQDADQGICLNIANNFYSFSHLGATLNGRNVTRSQYYWDVQWLWQAALGVGDNSQYYPGAVDFACVVAHGAPWEFSSLSNYGEWVDLHNMDHYGANSPSGNPSKDYTSYMLFTACSMMPAPGDPYGGDFTTGGVFDVYWNIFWGMHGMYGYRTTAGKQACVDSFSSFAFAGGVGCPLTASWMNATGSLDHSGGWNYGTAVLPSGRESDTMFNTTALPAATSLSMWWNHP